MWVFCTVGLLGHIRGGFFQTGFIHLLAHEHLSDCFKVEIIIKVPLQVLPAIVSHLN